MLWSLRVLGFPRLQLRGSIVHRGGSIHREVCVLERAEVEVFPVVPSQEIRSDSISGESLPLLLLLFKMLPQLHLRSEPFSLRVKEVDVKSARGLSLLPLDNLQTKGFKESRRLVQCLPLFSSRVEGNCQNRAALLLPVFVALEFSPASSPRSNPPCFRRKQIAGRLCWLC